MKAHAGDLNKHHPPFLDGADGFGSRDLDLLREVARRVREEWGEWPCKL